MVIFSSGLIFYFSQIDDAVMIADNNQNKENRKKGKQKLKISLGRQESLLAEHDFSAR